MPKDSNVYVVVGEGVVTVKREGSNRAVLAKVLGKVEVDGVEVLCLDRLVHESHEQQFGEWTLAGAVTTLLSGSMPPPTGAAAQDTVASSDATRHTL